VVLNLIVITLHSQNGNPMQLLFEQVGWTVVIITLHALM
jgi:hypothetical protein